jgi:hypothetical protein
MTRPSDWPACGSNSTMSGLFSDAGVMLVATVAQRLGLEGWRCGGVGRGATGPAARTWGAR